MGEQITNDNSITLEWNLKWTPPQDDILIQLMVEQQRGPAQLYQAVELLMC